MKTLILVRQKALGNRAEHLHVATQKRSATPHRSRTMAQREMQGAVIKPQHASKKPSVIRHNRLLILPVRAQKSAAQHGVRLSETKPETKIARRSSREFMAAAFLPAHMNSTGIKTAASDSVIETMVKTNFFRSAQRCCHRRSPSPWAHDFF